MTPERGGRLLGLTARRDADRDGAGAARRCCFGARVLGDRVDAGRTEPSGDHGSRVARRTHPDQDHAPGPRGDRAPHRRAIQPVRERPEPLGLRFQVAEEQLGVHLDPAVYGAAPAPRPCVVSLTPT